MINQLIKGKRYIYDLVLCKSNKEPICFIPYDESSFSFTRNWHDANSVSFNVNKYIQDYNGKQINPAWKQLNKSLLIHLYIREYHPTTNFTDQVKYEELFYINSAEYNADDQTKSISAESWHKVHFENIKLRGYEQTRKLYDYELVDGIYEPVKYDVNDFLKGGILNYIIEYKLPNWTVEYDYDNFSVEYSDNDKASINYVKNLIDKYIKATDENGNEVSSYTDLYNKWVTWVDNLGQIFGYSLVNGNEIIINESTLAALADKSSCSQVNGLLQYRIDLTTNNKLSADEVGKNMSGNALVNTAFGADWLTSESMPVGTSDEYNTNIITIIYKMMFSKMFNNLKNVLSLMVDIDFNIPEKVVYDSDERSETGYINLATGKLVKSTSADGRIGLKDLYDLTLQLYQDTADVYDAICGLSVETKEVYRNLTFSNDDLYSVFTQLEDSYICFFKFDNVNNIIYVYSRENEIFNKSSNLIISPYNYMSGYSYSSNQDKIVTRLYFTGKDNLTFTGVNPTGQRFLDDFSPFLNSDIYMSDELKAFLNFYNTSINDYMKSTYTTTVNGNHQDKIITSILNDYINGAKNRLRTAISYFTTFYRFASDESGEFTDGDKYEYRLTSFKAKMIASFQVTYDYISACNDEYYDFVASRLVDLDDLSSRQLSGMGFSEYISSMIDSAPSSNIEQARQMLEFFGVDITSEGNFDKLIEDNSITYYDNTETVIPSIVAVKKGIYESLTYDSSVKLYISLNYPSLSTEEQEKLSDNIISECNNFVFEDDISVDYITNADVALKYTLDYFKYIHTIPYEIKIDLVDILSNSNMQRDWDNICALGTYIVIHSPETEEYEKVRLLSYTHSPGNSNLSLTFGNSEELIDCMHNITKKVWQYSMKLAEKSQNYISQYDTVIKEAAARLNIELPATNYDFSTYIDYGDNVTNVENIFNSPNGSNNETNTTPPNTSNPSGSSSNNNTTVNNVDVKISSVLDNAVQMLSDGLYVPDLTSRINGGTGTTTGGGSGSGTGGGSSGGLGSNHIILSAMPTQAEIDTYADDTIVLIYDPNNPYIDTAIEDTTTDETT